MKGERALAMEQTAEKAAKAREESTGEGTEAMKRSPILRTTPSGLTADTRQYFKRLPFRVWECRGYCFRFPDVNDMCPVCLAHVEKIICDRLEVTGQSLRPKEWLCLWEDLGRPI